MNPFTNPIAFYFDKPTNVEDDFHPLTTIQQYLETDALYIIALEVTPRAHYHVVADMDISDYNSFIQTFVCNKKKWNLRGRATKGLPKQYGKLLGIKKPDKMIAYTLKQGAYVSNISQEILTPFADMSFIKDKATADRELRDKCLDHLEQQPPIKNDEHLKRHIIKWMLANNIFIRNRNSLECYFRHIRQFSHAHKQDSPLWWYDELYPPPSFLN